MAKCVTCGKTEIADDGWTWQPFGPGEHALLFSFPGGHFRGFPALHVCDDCKQAIKRGEIVTFKYRGKVYRFAGQVMEAI